MDYGLYSCRFFHILLVSMFFIVVFDSTLADSPPLHVKSEQHILL